MVAREEQIVLSQQSYSGPLPHPDLLQRYENVSAGLATRIVQMAELEGLHRRALDKQRLDADVEYMRSQVREVRRGQFLAFGVAMAFIGGSVYVTVHGFQWAGASMSLVGVGSIVSAFIWGRTPKAEREPEEPPKSQVSKASA